MALLIMDFIDCTGFLFAIMNRDRREQEKYTIYFFFLKVHAEAPALPLWETRFQTVIIAAPPKKLSKFFADNKRAKIER
jgi:hypothetical protein